MKNEFLKVSKGKNSIHAIYIPDIIHICSEGAYSVVHLSTDRKHKVSRNLKTVFGKLNGQKYFYRPHKSHVVNLSKIKEYTSEGSCGTIVMVCGTTIPVSKRERPGFLKAYRKY
jgi:two-component system LytT family response regulator